MRDDQDEDTQIMTPEEAAKWLRLADLGHPDPVQTVLRLREDGKIKPRRLIAGRVAFVLADLKEFVRGTATDRHSGLLDGTKRRQHNHAGQRKPLRLITDGG